jgi:excisionase family DNA binding protein
MRAAVVSRESNGEERMIVTMTIADLREIVREELQAVSASGKPEPLLLDTDEAAQFLNVPPTWLASMAREQKIKSVKLGHYVRFARADLEAFILQMKKNDHGDQL